MADLRTLQVVQDSGSEELKRLRKSYNSLLDALGTFMDSLEAATADATVIACATAFLATVESDTTGVLKITGDPETPNRPARAVTS
jgi:hypothetical protein